MTKITLDDISDHIIILYKQLNYDLNHSILHNLLYYCQAWYLALYNKPLFEDKFQAGIFGPVNFDLKIRLNINKFGNINENHILNPSNDLPIEIKDHIEEVINIYSKYNSFQLSNIVRKELPWIHARQDVDSAIHSTNEINENLMKDYYQLVMKYNKL